MNKQELDWYLVDEAEYSERAVERMSPKEKLDAYLRYNGIHGYTDDVWELCAHLMGIVNEDETADHLDDYIVVDKDCYNSLIEEVNNNRIA